MEFIAETKFQVEMAAPPTNSANRVYVNVD